ncbi:MAG: SMP-30/gluconolactonase/LRE family protein [Opitutaceae bacterium]|nr:SMP-30/gluconolactonase/LRE family protein [Opitutaceae bacterium]
MLPRSFFLLLGSGLIATAAPAPAPDRIFTEGSEWEVVSSGHRFAEGMAWDADGHFYFTDVPANQLFKVDRNSGSKTLLDGATGRANGIAFGPDGRLYGCASGDRCIYAWDPKSWQKAKVTEGTPSNDIAILRDGTIFYTEPGTNLVWRLAARTFARDVGVKLSWQPNGIALSRDEKTLLVAEFNSDTVHGFALGADGKVNGDDRAAYKLAVPSDGVGRLDGMMTLADGRLLVGTTLGTQIAPAITAVGSARHMMIRSPQGRPRNNYVRLSPDGAWIYSAYAADILRRRLRPDFEGP